MVRKLNNKMILDVPNDLNLGIIDSHEINYKKLILMSSDKRSFFENFHVDSSIRSLKDVDNYIDHRDTPFTLIVSHRYGFTLFIPTDDIKVHYNDNFDVYKKYTPSLLDEFSGYGNVYVTYKVVVLPTDCCSKRSSHEDYMKFHRNRTRGVSKALNWLRTNKGGDTFVVPVSNCGIPLLQEGENNRLIKHFLKMPERS